MPMAQVNMNMLPTMNPHARYGMPMMYPAMPSVMAPAVPSVDTTPANNKSEIPDSRTLRIAEENYAKLQLELKDLDRSEVLQRDLLTPFMRTEITKQRVSLVMRLDESRRGITEIKRIMEDVTDTSQEKAMVAAMNDVQLQNSQDVRQLSYSQMDAAGYAMPNFGNASVNFQNEQQALAATTMNIGGGEMYLQQYKSQPMPFGPPPLQERSGNVGHGFDSGRDVNIRPSGGSFDKVVPHPVGKRSHAIEIKKPNEPAKSKSLLNPASPSYEPFNVSATAMASEATRASTPGSFVPSPRLVAEMDNLVRSPNEEERVLMNSTGKMAQQPSVSSVSTGDFFPHDTHHHSTTKYSFAARDFKVGLPSWVPKSDPPDLKRANSCASTKFLWDDGPGDERATAGGSTHQSSPWAGFGHQPDGSAAVTASSKRAPGCDMDFITQATFSQISPATQRRQSSNLYDPSASLAVKSQKSSHSIHVSAPNVLEKAGLQASSIGGSKLTMTPAYWEGFQMGMQQDVLTEIKDEEYCRGYRDGLLKSNSSSVQPRSPAAYTAQQQASPSAFSDAASMPVTGIPRVPANSLVNSPLHFASESHPTLMHFPGSVNSPWSAPQSQAGAQTSNTQLNQTEPTSPLAGRAPVSVNAGSREVRTGRVPSNTVVQGPFPSNTRYNQQRHSKAPTSVAPSNNQARGSFLQLDGSGDEVLNETPSNVAPPTSPVMKTLAKFNQPPSPVKRTASAAMTKVQQIAGLGGKKDKSSADVQPDPAKMSSPEKAQWRTKWRRRFDNLKEDEQKEIAKYKKDHPMA